MPRAQSCPQGGEAALETPSRRQRIQTGTLVSFAQDPHEAATGEQKPEGREGPLL